MNRNDPCPCGSGKKYKKCHGGAVPPEAATLPAAVRASVMRAEAAMQRHRRITQEILDWADRRLGAEWMDGAYNAWGLGAEEELVPEEGNLFTTWAVYHYRPDTNDTAATQWLAAQRARFGARLDADTVAMIDAHVAAQLDVWEVTEPEPGVGVHVRARRTHAGSAADQAAFKTAGNTAGNVAGNTAGDGIEHYVYEVDASHDLAPPHAVLAYVIPVDDVHLFGGLHDVPLEPPELDEALAAMPSGEPPAHVLPAIRAHWWRAAERYFDRLDAEAGDEPEDEATDGDDPEEFRE